MGKIRFSIPGKNNRFTYPMCKNYIYGHNGQTEHYFFSSKIASEKLKSHSGLGCCPFKWGNSTAVYSLLIAAHFVRGGSVFGYSLLFITL